MPLAAYNAKIQQTLGSKIIGRDLWGTYFGVELEAEVDVTSKVVTAYIESFPESRRVKLLLPSSEEDINTPVAHFVCDALYPSVKEFCIIKRDGSLTNGVEIVSLPMSIDMH